MHYQVGIKDLICVWICAGALIIELLVLTAYWIKQKKENDLKRRLSLE